MTRQVNIAPSVLAADLACLGEEVSRAEEGGCDAFHIDIMDHHFVPNLSFGPNIVSTMRRLTDRPLDVHLMVDNPLDMLDAFADAGSDYLTVHIELAVDADAMLGAIRERGVRPGLTLNPDTPVERVLPFLDRVDILLVMSVFPGFGGQRFISESYNRIRTVADAASLVDEPPLLSVDGGVDLDNAAALVRAGATHLVAGTAVFSNHKAGEHVRRMREVILAAG